MSDWISVNDEPLLLPDEGDTWKITKAGRRTFIARIPIIRKGELIEWIGWCYIPEGTTDLYYVGDDDETGWFAQAVTHYIIMPLPEPPKP